MSRFLLSYIDSGTKNLVPTPIARFNSHVEASEYMHKNARFYLAELLQQKYATLFPKPIRLRFDLRKVPTMPYTQIATKNNVKTLSTEAFDKLNDVCVAGEYALLYMNDEETWLDVVRVHERVPSWWQWGGRTVTFETLRSFALQATKAKSLETKRHMPAGGDAKAFSSWCQKRDQVMVDLNNKLAEQAKNKRTELSNSVLRFEWDD
jgi:hypothetical protein